MPHISDDDVLLSRYVDGEISAEERQTIESRLAAEPNLRSQLAELVSLSVALEIGLAGASVGDATAPTAPRPVMGAVAFARSHRGLVAAAAVLCLAIVGTVAWWAASRNASAARQDPYHIIEAMDAGVDKCALRADVASILDQATPCHGRLEIYGRWHQIPARTIEPLVWAVAPFEADSRARVKLLGLIGAAEPVADYPALLARTRAEWASKQLAPLAPLIRSLGHYRGPETERFFAEVLEGRQQVRPRWFAELLPTIQATFPTSPTICQHVVRALGDPDEIIRAKASLARAEIGQRDGIECARTLLTSPDADVRLVAATTIARHGWETDIPFLLPLANDPDPTVQSFARTALTKHKIPIPSNP